MALNTQKELLNECYSIVLSFLKDKKLEDFWEPVKWKEYGLFDYLNIIKTPMDLTTMKNKFESNQYNSVFEFAYDMRLMWKNCLTYNQDGCIVVEVAKRYQRIFEERFTKILNSNVSELANVYSTMKRTLFQDVSRLKHEQVSCIIQMIWEICPDAIVETNETLNIDVDSISKYAYYIILSYVESLELPPVEDTAIKVKEEE